uniref:N-acetyltransferase ESCO acetyl-transferase domain-containing protein n=2 Tax=Clastoptera arizonana TaxID=38151 RepID=A0A1B6D9F3_9HEMI
MLEVTSKRKILFKRKLKGKESMEIISLQRLALQNYQLEKDSHSLVSDTSDASSSVSQELFENFQKQLLIAEPSWFTKKSKMYKGILNNAVIQKLKIEEEGIEEELERDALKIKHKYFMNKFTDKNQCSCYCHLNTWSAAFINKIHNHLWLLKCEKLQIMEEMVIGRSVANTIDYIKVPASDREPWRQKANQVVRFMDLVCGFDERFSLPLGFCQPSQRQIYLAVMKKDVIGCVIVEPVSMAYPLLESDNDIQVVGAECEVKWGINRIWVDLGYRRRGLASTLLKIVQTDVGSKNVRKEDLAFSTLTEDAKYFAQAYLNTRNVPIYVKSPSWKQ